MKERNGPSEAFDLLRLRALRLVTLSLLFPYAVQASILVVFVWMAAAAWGQFTPEGVPSKQFAQTNLVTLVIWGLCLQCAKACPSSNMGLFVRRPFPISDMREAIASWPVVLFLMVVSGYVSYELCSEWRAAQAVFLWVPEKTAAALGLSDFVGWIKGLWAVVVVPFILWTILGLPVILLGGAKNLGEAWRRLALPMMVILAAGHMAKGLAKSAQWAGYFPWAWDDSSGVTTAQAIVAGTMDKPGPLLPKAVISTVCLMLLLVMACFALRESRLAEPATHKSRVFSLTVAILASAVLIFGWRFST